jgi:glyoxylate reductase
MNKVFVTRIIPQAGKKLLEDAGISITEWELDRNLSPSELIAHCLEADALLSSGPNQIDQSFLNACSHLKVIALLSVGYDNLDLPEAIRLKIPVGNTPGVLSGATADTAFLLMLATSRKAFYLHRTILQGEWKFFEPTKNLGIELNGKTLGIFGLGKIGFEMAKRAAGAYGMKIIYHNRSRNSEAEKMLGAERVSFDRLLSESDVISVHSSLTPETRGIFNRERFRSMKPTAIFINAARGSIHNEADLLEALTEGRIWGAGLDVTNPEPMEPDNPLLLLPTVSVLPHIGSATVETRDAMAVIAAKNILAGLKGNPLPYPIMAE